MAVHPSMRTMLIIAILGPMTLRTQGHHLGELHRSSISQMQAGIAIERIMAGDTGLPAVVQAQTLVELIEVRHRASLAIGGACRMAVLAGYGNCLASLIS